MLLQNVLINWQYQFRAREAKVKCQSLKCIDNIIGKQSLDGAEEDLSLTFFKKCKLRSSGLSRNQSTCYCFIVEALKDSRDQRAHIGIIGS